MIVSAFLASPLPKPAAHEKPWEAAVETVVVGTFCAE